MSNPSPQPQEAATAQPQTGIRRLNWGCGDYPERGWVNSDIKEGPGIEISCDIREGLPGVSRKRPGLLPGTRQGCGHDWGEARHPAALVRVVADALHTRLHRRAAPEGGIRRGAGLCLP